MSDQYAHTDDELRSGDVTLDLALADREAEAEAEAVELEMAEAVTEGPAGAPGPISSRAFDLIVTHETGGRAYYERIIKSRPVWPGAGSGITIGFGYDLGYVTEAKLRRDWARLGTAALDRLALAVGRRGGAAADMKALARSLADVIISFEAGEAVFEATTLPEFKRTTWTRLPNCDRLSSDSFGALVSLTFNRGPSFDKDGERYREMRAIKAAMTERRFDAVAGLIRAMTRIWIGGPIEAEMTRRRENEARLFEDGLRGRARPITEGAAGAAPDDDAVSTGPSDEDFFPDPDGETGEGLEATAETEGPALARWAADAESIDYAHLGPLKPPGSEFDFTAAHLARLCALNAFPVEALDRPVLFGLRGCTIVSGGDDGLRASVRLADVRPDHRSTRCVMGVWDRTAGTIAVFPASTVPNQQAMAGWVRDKKAGNMLSTGFYRYIVGPHNGKPGCFLLRKTLDEKRVVMVRRSSEDLCYEQTDVRDLCAPGDNIHPAFSGAPRFSSVGCQVVAGSANPAGVHTGPWSRFRKLAGLTTGSGPAGAYGYVLLTGAEARLVATGNATDLRRLRFGSSGEAVKRLQVKLGLPDPDGGFGPNTSLAWHRKQEATSAGRSDGVYGPEVETTLGWDALGAA